MRWSELDIEARLWVLPSQEDFVFARPRRDGSELKEGRTKNTLEHRVPLASQAAAILGRSAIAARKAELGYPDRDLVFSTTGKTPPSGWSRAKQTLDARMRELLGTKFKPWRIHDLRRTCATGMENLKIPVHVVETALNHISGVKSGIVGVYQCAEHREAVRAAFEAWDAIVAGLTSTAQHPNTERPAAAGKAIREGK